MAFDLDAVKAELGITDNDATRDAAIERMRKATLVMVESYLDRRLEYVADDLVVVARADRPLVVLSRYPVTDVLDPAPADVGDGVAPDSKTTWRRDIGLVEDSRFIGRRVVVRFAGGFSFADSPPAGVPALPADLEQALLDLTVSRWEAREGGSLGGVDSVTIEGLGTMRMNRPDRAVALDRGIGGGLMDHAHVLDRYSGVTL
jgi:hypothetical protein